MTMDIIIGVAGILFGFVTSYIFYRIQKRRRELCWSIDSTNLIKGYSSLFEKLEVQYGGQKIENLTVSKIVFWNNGNETIDGTDIAIPPHIFAREEDTEILDIKVITTSTTGNGFTAQLLEKDLQIVAIRFDYLDPQQGAVIQVIHTGVSVLPLVLRGEVKGLKDIEYKTKRLDPASQISRLFIYFYAVMMSVMVGVYVYNSVFRGTPARADWFTWVLGVLWILVLVALYFDIRDRRNTARIPKELSAFEDDDIGVKTKVFL